MLEPNELQDIIRFGLRGCRRVTCPASALVIGVQCGGSDACSGVTGSPAVGVIADLLVRAGTTVFTI